MARILVLSQKYKAKDITKKEEYKVTKFATAEYIIHQDLDVHGKDREK